MCIQMGAPLFHTIQICPLTSIPESTNFHSHKLCMIICILLTISRNSLLIRFTGDQCKSVHDAFN